MRKLFEIGGYVSAALLIAFGIGALMMSVNAHNTVGTELSRELIVGSPDMSPTEITKAVQAAGLSNVPIPSCNVADKAITTGADARCFAQYMRIHALESSGGSTYAQMGRFAAAANPADPKGTSDEAAAMKDAAGKPVSNGARNTWVTETALSTALNVSYMASQIALFGIVVGIALLLSGIGFAVLVIGGSLRRRDSAAESDARIAPAVTPPVVPVI